MGNFQLRIRRNMERSHFMPLNDNGATSTKSGVPILCTLGLGMFVYVIDTTIMRVSISDLVVDLDTDIAQINLAITLYTLTMAAFMLTGAKLGDIWGARRAFRIGLVIYAVGTVTTAAAPTVFWLIFGWSILEGLGSALIVPAINTLIRSNFSGLQRASAYGIIGGVAAAGAAVGPIIGGWITTTYTWRLAFAIEACIVALVLAASVLLVDSRRRSTAHLDLYGVLLSAAGLGLFVLSIVQIQAWGWGDWRVWSMLLVGLAISAVFAGRAVRLERAGQDTIVRFSVLRRRSMAAGVPVYLAQMFVMSGTMYVVTVFVQLVLGLDALNTGLSVLPFSIAVMIAAATTAKLGHYISPKAIIQFALLLLVGSGAMLAYAIPDAVKGGDIAFGMFVMGMAMGLIAAQLPNLMLGGVATDESSEAAGLQGTAQNLGMSLGTAMAGSVVFVMLTLGFASGVAHSAVLPGDSKDRIESILALDADKVGTAMAVLLESEEPEVRTEVKLIAKRAHTKAFQLTVVIMGLIGLLGYVFAFWLPNEKLSGDVVEEAVRSSQMIPKLQLESTDPEPGQQRSCRESCRVT